jgi:hypothetical protein
MGHLEVVLVFSNLEEKLLQNLCSFVYQFVPVKGPVKESVLSQDKA